MSMITCSERGVEVSTLAKTCPGCGAGARVFRKPARKPLGREGTIGVGAVVAGLVVISSPLVMGSTTSSSKSAEDLAHDNRIHAADLAVNMLRPALREPDSAVFERVGVDESARAVCLTYPARNGFGGMNREHMVVLDGQPSQRASTWNKHCAHNGLYDYTDVSRL